MEEPLNKFIPVFGEGCSGACVDKEILVGDNGEDSIDEGDGVFNGDNRGIDEGDGVFNGDNRGIDEGDDDNGVGIIICSFDPVDLWESTDDDEWEFVVQSDIPHIYSSSLFKSTTNLESSYWLIL